MAQHQFDHYLNEFQARPKPRRWWPKTLAICAILGGIYGAAIGSVISTSAGATNVIGIAAGILAFLFAFPGARYGFFFGMVNRVRFGQLFVGTIAAIVGAILGGYLGFLAVTPFGMVLLGAVGGWFVAQAVLFRRGFLLRRLLGGLGGVLLGTCVGAVIVALQKDQGAALVGIAWGVGIGAVVGPLLLLLFIGALNSLLHTHASDGGELSRCDFPKT